MAAAWNDTLAAKTAWLRELVRRHVRRPDEVEDVVQEVLAAAITQPPGSRNGARTPELDRWLRGLALNKIRMHRRSEARRRAREREAVRPELDDRAISPLGLLIGAERSGLLRRALEGMRPEDAQLMKWKYDQDWDYRRIAAKLGVSRDAVANRLRSARDRLREAISSLMSEE